MPSSQVRGREALFNAPRFQTTPPKAQPVMPDENWPASTQLRPDADRERRRWARAAGSFVAVIGRARLLPRLSGHYPSLRPDGRYQVIDRNPEAVEPTARAGYIWIQVDGRLRHVWAAHFELEVDPP